MGILDGLFGGNNTTTQTSTMDPWLKGILSSNVNRANSIADRPFEAYTGQGYAPMSTNQQYAQQGARNLNGAGAPAINMAVNGAGGLLGYQPSQVGGAAFTSMMPTYMNPFTDQVVDRTLGDIERQRKMAIGDNTDRAIASRAFGGSRQGVMDANTNEAYGRIAGDAAANLRSTGFNTAATMAQQSTMANQNADLAGAGVRMNAGGLLGDLGQRQFNNATGYVNALNTTGAVDQATQQGQNQFDYTEFLRRMGYPIQGQQVINQSLGLLPSSNTVTTQGPNNSGANAVNGLLGIGQTAAMLGWNPFGA